MELKRQTKKKQVKDFTAWRKKVTRIALLIFVGMLLQIAIDSFFDRYIIDLMIIKPRYTSPVPLKPEMGVINNVEPDIKVVTPTSTPKKKAGVHLVKEVRAAETAIDMDKLFEIVRQLESQKGTADAGHHVYCREKGMWNEVGYGNRDGYCFKDMAEGKEVLLKWYQNKFERGMTLEEAMCYWESGHAVAGCTYYKNFLKLS